MTPICGWNKCEHVCLCVRACLCVVFVCLCVCHVVCRYQDCAQMDLQVQVQVQMRFLKSISRRLHVSVNVFQINNIVH